MSDGAIEVGQYRIEINCTVSPSTVNRTFWMLAAFGEWCVERKYHLSNPWKVESLPETQTPPPSVDDATLARVLMALSARWRPVVEFAAETGMRKGELGRLHWEDVAGDVAWVVSSHARGLTKARKTRPVPLSRRALAVLDALPRREDGAVFGPVGDPRRAFKRAAVAAGLGRVWMHLFRHRAASRAAEGGATPQELQMLGGWSSLRMVERYTHARLDRLREVLNRGEVPGGRHSEPARPGALGGVHGAVAAPSAKAITLADRGTENTRSPEVKKNGRPE